MPYLPWRPPPDSWVKFHVDDSKRRWTKSASVGYVMRGNHSNFITANNKWIKDSILVAECLVMRDTILTASQKDFQRTIV